MKVEERVEALESDKQKQKEEIEKLEKDLRAKAEAKAKQAKKTVTVATATYKVGCEQYIPLLKKYPWDIGEALLVMSKESGCRYNAKSATNDHGLFQLHNQAVYDPTQNIAIAYAKYRGGRVGRANWSAWYAVCTPGNNPQPKYTGIRCQ